MVKVCVLSHQITSTQSRQGPVLLYYTKEIIGPRTTSRINKGSPRSPSARTTVVVFETLRSSSDSRHRYPGAPVVHNRCGHQSVDSRNFFIHWIVE